MKKVYFLVNSMCQDEGRGAYDYIYKFIVYLYISLL